MTRRRLAVLVLAELPGLLMRMAERVVDALDRSGAESWTAMLDAPFRRVEIRRHDQELFFIAELVDGRRPLMVRAPFPYRNCGLCGALTSRRANGRPSCTSAHDNDLDDDSQKAWRASFARLRHG